MGPDHFEPVARTRTSVKKCIEMRYTRGRRVSVLASILESFAASQVEFTGFFPFPLLDTYDLVLPNHPLAVCKESVEGEPDGLNELFVARYYHAGRGWKPYVARPRFDEDKVESAVVELFRESLSDGDTR